MNPTFLMTCAGIRADDLAALTGRSRATIYNGMKVSPPPMWLLEAIDSWYAKNAPLPDKSVDTEFRRIFGNLIRKVLSKFSILRDWDMDGSGDDAPPRGKKRSKHAQHTGENSSVNQAAQLAIGGGQSFARLTSGAAGASSGEGFSHESEKPSFIGEGGNDGVQHNEIAQRTEERARSTGIEKGASVVGAILPLRGVPELSGMDREGNQEQTESAPLWRDREIQTAASAAQVWAYLRTDADRAAFKADCLTRGFCQGKSDRAFYRAMQSRVGKAHRPGRKIDAELADRREELLQYLLGKVAAVETEGVAGFGAHYENACWMDQRATLRGLYRTTEVQDATKRIYGSVPSLIVIDRWFRERHGVASKLEIASDKLRANLHATTGIQANWAGEFFYCDATRLPVFVDGAWGKARKNGMAHWMHALTDDRSLRTLIYVHALPSETAAWDTCLVEWIKRLGYAPPQIYTDNASRLTPDLYNQKYENGCTLNPGVRLLIAIGTHLSSHTKNNPQAKGRIEAGAMKAGKSELKSCLIANAVMKAIPLRNYRCVDSQAEWNGIISEWEKMLNARARGENGTRLSTFEDHAESAAKRAALALDGDAMRDWRKYTDAMRLARVHGKTIKCKRIDGETVTAELIDERGILPINRMDGCCAIVAPSGLRAGDDADYPRVVIVDALDKARISRHYTVRAKAVAKTFWGDLEKAKFGTHPVGKIHTFEMQRKNEWALAAHPEWAAREATNDAPVDGAQFGADE
jgi:hypothetical protein